MSALVEKCLKEMSSLANQRSSFESHWREVAEGVRPIQNFFNQKDRTPGDKRNDKIFDATAPLALPKFAAAVISMAFPPTQKYHKLTIKEPGLMGMVEVKRYLDALNDRLFQIRYAPHSGFQSQSSEVILDVGAFGTGILFIDDFLGRGIRYKSLPLAQTFIGEDEYGRINTLYRQWEWNAQQAVSAFGLENLPDSIQKAFVEQPNKKFEFIHVVKPNTEKVEGAMNYKGMDYSSYYISTEGKKLISEGGYRTFPFAVPRFETSPNEVYGRSPAMKVLPAIKTLNEMKKTILRAAHLQVAPPIMLSEDGVLQAFNVRPSALNFNSIDNSGRPKAIPFNTGGRVDIGMDLMNVEREAINDAFYVTLFRILVDEPQITATEAMLRAQEKGQLLSPTMGRIQSEMMGAIVERELDILMTADGGSGNLLPPMPEALVDYFGDDGEYEIEYQSPLNQAQRAGEGSAILNTLNSLSPLAQIDPTVMQRFDVEKAAEILARINGVPETVIRSDEEVTELKDMAAGAEQAKQLLDAAPVAAGAAKDMAQAAALSASSPNQVAPDLGLQ